MTTPIDLRSDTVTKPSAGMRRAIAEAEVGDDVFGEDPSVAKLQARVAELLGKEAALFVPTGTMANQVSIRCHTEPGDEVILEAAGHSYAFETGAMAALNGVQARPVASAHGILEAKAVEAAINAVSSHFARTRMIVVENTSNRGGGTIYGLERVKEIAAVAARHQLVLHMDGARLWNAHVATGTPLAAYTAPCASVSVCLSKGLGAPVGSVVAGTKDFIGRAHRFRKMFGGGMRQVGVLAAAGLYALEHNVARLAEDHAKLRALAEGLARVPGLSCDPALYPTNICYVHVTRPDTSAAEAVQRMRAAGVLAHPTGPKEIRFVTHLDVPADAIPEAVERARRALA